MPLTIYAVWFAECDTVFGIPSRFVRVTDETPIDVTKDCDRYLTADQIERHILKLRDLKPVLQIAS